MPERTPRPGIILSSRATNLSYLDRIDPYYEVDYIQAARTSWKQVSTTEYRLRATPRGELAVVAENSFSPVRQPGSKVYSPHAIRMMAWLTQFHQMSTLQLATGLGIPATTAENTARSLYAAGVLKRARPVFWNTGDERPLGGTGSLWSVLRDHEAQHLQAWLDGLSPLEYLLLSGGENLTSGSQGSSGVAVVRHNMTAAEIALRALECCPGLAGVWGDIYADAERLMGGAEFRFMERIRNQADMVFVDRKGTIVVVEVSGSSRVDAPAEAQRLARKARNWSAVAARSNLDLKVLFLDISQRGRINRFRWHVQQGAEDNKLLVHASDRAKAMSSVYVASASDWFPLTSTVSRSFQTLQGWSLADRKWHDLITDDPSVDAESDVVVNTLAALHTPTWIVQQPSAVL